MKRMEFSKKLLVFIECLVIALFVLTCIAVFKGDASALVALITGVFSLASIAFGFYFWKAKNENIRKYAKKVSWDEVEKIGSMYNELLGYEDEGI